MGLGELTVRIAGCDRRKARLEAVARPRNHGDGYPLHDFRPPVPAREVQQVVRPHQPDKARIGCPLRQLPDRVGGVAGAELGLDVGDMDRGMMRHIAGTLHALGKRRHALHGLERVLRRYEPPHLVQFKPAHGHQADMPVALMGRVERAAEQADAQAVRQAGQEGS